MNTPTDFNDEPAEFPAFNTGHNRHSPDGEDVARGKLLDGEVPEPLAMSHANGMDF